LTTAFYDFFEKWDVSLDHHPDLGFLNGILGTEGQGQLNEFCGISCLGED